MASSRTSRSRYRLRSTGRDIRPRLISGEMRRGCQPGVGSRRPAIGRARGVRITEGSFRASRATIVCGGIAGRFPACRNMPRHSSSRSSSSQSKSQTRAPWPEPGRASLPARSQLASARGPHRSGQILPQMGRRHHRTPLLHQPPRHRLGACRLDDTAGSTFDCGPACPLKLLSPL